MTFVPKALLAAVVLGVLPASADVLLMDVINDAPTNTQDGLLRPSRGLSMTQVSHRFGEPEQKLPWVGDPPITRWVSDRYTVYFEYQHVIHSVVHR